MAGRAVLPPEENRADFRMANTYTDVCKVNEECLKADDVTWVGRYEGLGTEVGNELVVAWLYGDKVDKIGTASEAIGRDDEVGSAHFRAGKAESAKVPAKKRLTASAPAGFRALMSWFEACVRHRAEDLPGFGQAIDPFQLLGKFNAMIKHSRRAETSCVSSHDVSGWSEFESRSFKLAYFYYETWIYADKEFRKALIFGKSGR